MTQAGIADLALQTQPIPILWAATDDGGLFGITYEPNQDVIAGHRHIPAGRDAFVESLAVCYTPNAQRLWMAVSRTINGQTVRTMEYLDPSEPSAPSADFFLDCGLRYDGPDTDHLTGLEHLEGETVSVNANGFVIPDLTVKNGQVALGARYRAPIQAGLSYRMRLTTLPPEGGVPNGTAQGRQKSWSNIRLRVLDTVPHGAICGRSIPDMAGTATMNEPEPPFSGDIEVGSLGWGKDGTITIESDKPLPFTLLALHGDLIVANT